MIRAIHFPGEPSATGLDFFADGHFTSRYEELGFYSSTDFIELGNCFGVAEQEVRSEIDQFQRSVKSVTERIESSGLSHDAQALYLAQFLDRLKALRQ